MVTVRRYDQRSALDDRSRGVDPEQMDERTPGPVLVGVTVAGENTAALRFAAEEAEREGRPVTLAHAVHQVMPPPPPTMLLTFQTLEEVGQRLVRDVADEFAPLNRGGVPVSTVVHRGHPVNVLVDLSRGGRMVVLQRRSLSKLHRVFTGSTVIGTSAHAHCPVVSVPESWTPPRSAGPVTVGVHEDGTSDAVLEAGFAEAASRDAPLHVFHAWRLADVYADLAPPPHDDAWTAQAEEALADQVAPFRLRYPQVAVATELRYQWPTDALIELSATSGLLVIGRHSTFAPLLQRIGSTARTAIGHAACPVMVVPVERAQALGRGPRRDTTGTPPPG
jgi:nucleotide-binding universal stress UspA family protein